jgi:hypothetical protein
MNLTQNWILNVIEVENIYKKCLNGEISKSGMHESIKFQLLEYAKEQQFKGLDFINKLLLANPGTTFQFWTDKYSNYTDSQKIINWLSEPEITQQINNLQPKQTETKKPPRAPELGFFCSLINKIGIDKRDETESATVYCKRICSKFNLNYTDRVRQNYNENETKKLIKDLIEKVLPLINNETKISIQKYLDNKQPPKQNLYG